MELDKKNYRQNDNKFRYFNRLAPWRVLGIDKRCVSIKSAAAYRTRIHIKK